MSNDRNVLNDSTTGEVAIGQLLQRRLFSDVRDGNVPDPKYYETFAIGDLHDIVYYCHKPFGKLIRAVGHLYYLYTRVLTRLHYWGFLDCEEGGSRVKAARSHRNWHLAFWQDRPHRWRNKITQPRTLPNAA